MRVWSHRSALWVVSVGLILMTAFGVRTYLALHPTMSPRYRDGTLKVVFIEPATKATAVADLLKRQGIIQDRFLFLFFALLRGSIGELKAGEYQFSPAMGLLDVIRVLEEGRVLVHRVTVPEGASVRQIADLLHEEGLADRERFFRLAMDRQVTASHVPEAETLEGFLFPDTYHFIKGLAEEEIIETLVRRFFRAFTGEDELRARQLGMNRYQIVTLASIIEKEAAVDREKPLIAAVFYNRLRQGMRLQADPTVIYGKRNGGRITRRDLQANHPYNTYIQGGLPPGPIASPGEAALRAALYPAQVKFLYFVSKNDGTHHFSQSLAEHQRAVRRYQ
ncbi:MAG: endolytic transglycosylase MltG [candidate division NC10 bacterium]|nr:endolytic transglycosylase MltG [candidate division NC10 bacterium]